MAAISAFRVTQHSQIFSLFFRNQIQCIALYQLHNSQALLNLRRGYFSACTMRQQLLGAQTALLRILNGLLLTELGCKDGLDFHRSGSLIELLAINDHLIVFFIDSYEATNLSFPKFSDLAESRPLVASDRGCLHRATSWL